MYQKKLQSFWNFYQDSGVDFPDLKRSGGWKSPSVPGDSRSNKIGISKKNWNEISNVFSNIVAVKNMNYNKY